MLEKSYPIIGQPGSNISSHVLLYFLIPVMQGKRERKKKNSKKYRKMDLPEKTIVHPVLNSRPAAQYDEPKDYYNDLSIQ